MTFVRSSYGLEAFGAHSIDTFAQGPIYPSIVTPSTSTWPLANMAIYVPICVRAPATVMKLWWVNHSTSTGNVCLALYDSAGTRLVTSGSNAKPATANEETFDVTDTKIPAGLFYIGMACSNATDTFYFDTDAAPLQASMGMRTEQLASEVLPATAAWGVNQSMAKLPIMGLLKEPTVA